MWYLSKEDKLLLILRTHKVPLKWKSEINESSWRKEFEVYIKVSMFYLDFMINFRNFSKDIKINPKNKESLTKSEFNLVPKIRFTKTYL